MAEKLYKTTVLIWTDFNPAGLELDVLAREAVVGDAYCSLQETILVDDPAADAFPPSMEFFGEVDDEVDQ